MWFIEQIPSWTVQILTAWFVGALAVVVCGLITLCATFPNDMKDFDDRRDSIPTPKGRWFHITSIVLGLLITYYTGFKIEL